VGVDHTAPGPEPPRVGGDAEPERLRGVPHRARLRDVPRDQGGGGRAGRRSAPGGVPRPVRGGPAEKPAPLLRLPPIVRPGPPEVPMKSRATSAYSLRRASGGGYSEGRTPRVAAKETGREGADQVPARQPRDRLPGRDHTGDRPGLPAGGRRQGGAAAPREA